MKNLTDLDSLTIVYRKIEELIPADYNPRELTEEQADDLEASLREFGAVDPAIINIHPKRKNIIIGGHQRISIASERLGWKTYPCVEVTLTLKKERELNVRLNKNQGQWDWDKLANQFDIPELKDWGFTEEELFGNNVFTEPKAEEDEFEVEDEYEIETDIKPGDLIEISGHRLMCGDSRDKAAVKKLLIGAKPILMVTDPPYGVNYDPQWRDDSALAVGNRSKGKVDNDDTIDWTHAYRLFPGDVAYVWHASLFSNIVTENLQESGFGLISQIIWAKQHFALSRGDYHWQHESCLYAVRRGKKHNWQGARDQSTLWEIKSNNAFGNSETETTYGHGTQKPMECMARPIRNNTKKGEGVYDPFIGSGTTMAAAHQLKRKCYAMEINPKYCQIVIYRMQALEPGISIKINGKPYTGELHSA